MRVLLTGASGFLGSHVLRRLLSRGDSVAVLLRPQADAWRIADLLGSTLVVRSGLGDLKPAAEAWKSFAPEAVVHLAWEGVAGKQYDDPAHVGSNLQGTVELASWAAASGCAFVGLGTQMEYGPQEGLVGEQALPRPQNLYGAGKLCAGLACGAVCARAGTRFAWLRLFSAYGPMDNPGWLIPSLILKLLRKERPKLTPGEQLWDYLYAEDAAEVVVRAAHSPDASGTFNLGSGNAVPVHRIAESIRDLIDRSLQLGLGDVPYPAGQTMRLEADIGRLHKAIGWSPAVSLEEGLQKTIGWYRKNARRFD